MDISIYRLSGPDGMSSICQKTIGSSGLVHNTNTTTKNRNVHNLQPYENPEHSKTSTKNQKSVEDMTFYENSLSIVTEKDLKMRKYDKINYFKRLSWHRLM